MPQKSFLVIASKPRIKQGWAQGKDPVGRGQMGDNTSGAANGKRAGRWGSFPRRAAPEKDPLLLMDALGNGVHP